MSLNVKCTLLCIIEVMFSIFAIFVFIEPLKTLLIILSVFDVIIMIISMIITRTHASITFSALILMYHLIIIFPLNLLSLAHYFGEYFNGPELSCYFCVSLILLIPTFFIELMKYGDEDNNEKVSLISIVFSTLELILLVLTTISDYIDFNIPYTKSIYLAILFSVTFKSVIKSVLKHIENICEKEAEKEISKQITEHYQTIQNCFEKAKKSEFVANAFFDYLSIYENSLNLADIKNIDSRTYIYIKNTCEDLFKEHPYWTDNQITTTYLYVWSKNKRLPNISIEDINPQSFFGF